MRSVDATSDGLSKAGPSLVSATSSMRVEDLLLILNHLNVGIAIRQDSGGRGLTFDTLVWLNAWQVGKGV